MINNLFNVCSTLKEMCMIIIYVVCVTHKKMYSVPGDPLNLPRRVLDSPFSVGTHQSFQILDFYNGGTHQTFQKCLLDSSKIIATSIPSIVRFLVRQVKKEIMSSMVLMAREVHVNIICYSWMYCKRWWIKQSCYMLVLF